MERIKVVIVHNGTTVAKISGKTPHEAFSKVSKFFQKKYLNGGV